MRAEGLETRPKSSPVATANPSSPLNASRAATRLAAALRGAMAPKPTVVMVCELKKIHCTKRPNPMGGAAGAQPIGPQCEVDGGKKRVHQNVDRQ